MRVSKQEFINTWNELKSPTKVSKALNMDLRGVMNRRRRLEGEFGIILSVNETVVERHSAIVRHETENGIIIVFSDAHFWPGLRTTAFRALLKFIPQLKPSVIVCNGDAFDGSSISRFPRIGWDSKPTVMQELEACVERMEEIERITKGVKLVWPLGNHDARYENYLASRAPEFEGMPGFSLKSHFPKWLPCWAFWVNNVCIKHRWKGGIHAAHSNTLNSGVSMVTGHLHSLKVTPYSDYTGTRWGVDTGTLADPDGPQFVDYTEAGPTNWRSGFVVLTFVDGELLPPETVNVMGEGKVCFRGKIIEC